MPNILDHLGLNEKNLPKNINNNYKQLPTVTNNHKLLQTSILIGSEEPQEVGSNLTASTPLGKPSREVEPLDSGRQMKVAESKPAAWRGVKYDLYQRGYLKSGKPNLQLNVGIIRSIDGAKMNLKAVLNQDFDRGFMSKGVEDWKTNPHWIKCKQHYKELSMIYDDVRLSKCIEPNRAGTWDLVVFVFQDSSNTWRVDLLRESQIHTVYLTGECSQLQLETNCIATRYFGQSKMKIKNAKKEGW